MRRARQSTNRHGLWFSVSLVLGMGAGCAGPLAGARSDTYVPRETRAVWETLVQGRDDDAAAGFRARLAQDPIDLLALFGDASLAFERGENARALASYLALLERAATAPDSWTSLLGAVAAGRIATLLDEHPGPEADRRAVEDRLMLLPLAKLRWEARHGLALIFDRVARRRADPNMLSRAARTAGCIRAFTVARPVGILPHLDLDSPVDKSSPEGHGARVIQSLGCVISVPAFAGRSGAQRVFTDIQVPGAGWYDVVLDFSGEARVVVDGATLFKHGNEHQYGPRASAEKVQLSPGRHRLELRLATFGGSPNLVVMVTPSGPNSSPMSAPHPLNSAFLSGKNPLEAASFMAGAYVANRQGDANLAWEAVSERRLGNWPRFALGLVTTAMVTRDDASRPANFGRDRARTLLRAAVALDPHLARSRHALAGIALDDDRPREALDEARAAAAAAPNWWPPQLTLHAAYRLRGLEWEADQALDRALARGPGACSVIVTALARAEQRRDLDAERRWGAALVACGQDTDEQIERMRRRGDLAGVEAALRRVVTLAPDRDDTKLELASVLLARGNAQAAADLIASVVKNDEDGSRRDGEIQVRLADALTVAGRANEAKALIARALGDHPEAPEILRAARALGLPLPLDPFRLDGRQVIRAFQASGRRYAAPAVIVLDRTVTRILPSGAEMILTHEIVRVQSKDAIQKWGEVAVPGRTEILVLRTHKADGTTREPEEFAGKETISAADLTIGDYLEKETIEIRPPRDAFVVNTDLSGGFLGDRFFFQSFDAPLDRSEYLLVTTPAAARAMSVDRRAGAPVATQTPGPTAGDTGGRMDTVSNTAAGDSAQTVVTTFAATKVPQLFAERSSVPAIEHVPSVRVSFRVGWVAWARFLREQMYGTQRWSPGLRRVADEIRASVPDGAPEALAAALAAWVGQNVEADDDLRDPASFGVARGRGNRLAVMLALARDLKLDASPVLARSRLTADGDAPTPLEEADDFADPLVRFEFPGKKVVYVDPRLKHAPFGYLPPGLDGARVLVLDRARFDIAHGRSDDHRAVDMAVRLDGQGGGVVQAAETLRGWPALEWAEIVDRFGPDRTKLRQDFEQRWLGVHFPGAVLKDLEIDILGIDGRDATSKAVTVPPLRPSPIASGIPYTAAQVRLRYSFTSSRLALKRDREIRFLPTFFRSQPGRRYATEPRRGTALLTGFDVPLDLKARVELPLGARLVDPQRLSGGEAGAGAGAGAGTSTGVTTGLGTGAGTHEGVVARRDGYRFLEERRLDSGASAAPVLLLRREARFPIMRVSLQEYAAVADELRRVDTLEQEEVRIGIGPERP